MMKETMVEELERLLAELEATAGLRDSLTAARILALKWALPELNKIIEQASVTDTRVQWGRSQTNKGREPFDAVEAGSWGDVKGDWR